MHHFCDAFICYVQLYTFVDIKTDWYAGVNNRLQLAEVFMLTICISLNILHFALKFSLFKNQLITYFSYDAPNDWQNKLYHCFLTALIHCLTIYFSSKKLTAMMENIFLLEHNAGITNVLFQYDYIMHDECLL